MDVGAGPAKAGCGGSIPLGAICADGRLARQEPAKLRSTVRFRVCTYKYLVRRMISLRTLGLSGVKDAESEVTQRSPNGWAPGLHPGTGRFDSYTLYTNAPAVDATKPSKLGT